MYRENVVKQEQFIAGLFGDKRFPVARSRVEVRSATGLVIPSRVFFRTHAREPYGRVSTTLRRGP
jgi:hypothetical protein